MSINLGGVYTSTTDAAIAAFDTEVKLVYQGAGYLRNTVRVKTGVTGQQYAFRRMGAGMAYQQTSSAEAITPNDTSHAHASVAMMNSLPLPRYRATRSPAAMPRWASPPAHLPAA